MIWCDNKINTVGVLFKYFCLLDYFIYRVFLRFYKPKNIKKNQDRTKKYNKLSTAYAKNSLFLFKKFIL